MLNLDFAIRSGITFPFSIWHRNTKYIFGFKNNKYLNFATIGPYIRLEIGDGPYLT